MKGQLIKLDDRTERHLLYWISFAITVVGICLNLVSSQIQRFSPEIRSLGNTFCSIGVIGFIFQFYFQRAFEKRLLDILIAFGGKNWPEIVKDAEKLGIRRILPTRYEYDAMRLELYAQARHVLWFTYHGANLPPQYNMVEKVLGLLKLRCPFPNSYWV